MRRSSVCYWQNDRLPLGCHNATPWHPGETSRTRLAPGRYPGVVIEARGGLRTMTTHELKRTRSAGILLHPTSLPGPYGIGDLGEAAHAWVDALVRARQT